MVANSVVMGVELLKFIVLLFLQSIFAGVGEEQRNVESVVTKF